ncbi:hypothetical protein DPEC_G00256220 [Dallia pectoralis]|uniref:Uncharacterized protein n=1 Tax=Dallia pectoralis TaxID=75939 RepID=A0ACC2FUP0_DALPE|nr:hypothetical protein DPEC_G00256220 [Dallia pectoralis]
MSQNYRAMQQCPVCTNMFPGDFIELHASSCGESAGNELIHESIVSEEEEAPMPGPSGTSATAIDDDDGGGGGGVRSVEKVIGRVTRQIKQLRRGLKETPMWTVLTQRPDTVALLFPKGGAGYFSPEVLLNRITWPLEEDDDDDNCSGDTKCRMAGYLRQFIANATPTELTNLVKFWTGWEILPISLSVEVVEGIHPTSSTCYETLRIPGHYKDYKSFKSDILACISTCQTGFGLV